VIKAIIFDCFGVLRVDPTFLAYRKLGGDDEADREFLESTMRASDAGQIPSATSVIAERLGVTEDMWRHVSKSVSGLDQDLLDYISELRKTYKVGLLTNIGHGDLERWFDTSVLDKYFDEAVASGDIGFAKPEPQAYEITAERLGVRADECIMVDDRDSNCDGARAVGMQAILYTAFPQLQRDLPAAVNQYKD
jgi:HAD superfamily hydrolase (TIGR01509 family)